MSNGSWARPLPNPTVPARQLNPVIPAQQGAGPARPVGTVRDRPCLGRAGVTGDMLRQVRVQRGRVTVLRLAKLCSLSPEHLSVLRLILRTRRVHSEVREPHESGAIVSARDTRPCFVLSSRLILN
ncbi:hypothetical protein MRB53_009158 [Persea americana]|uniref:Uncharacterized protein n=1 Tax=Persea americana TaxID=3435 RepID=A0ACC2LNA2_PERAE|nr:hypothetical protein MRB53_009158 [Persea americana]